MPKKKRTFTLIELLVAVVIIGILATLGVPAYQNIIEDAHLRVDLANKQAIETALSIDAMEHDTVPGTITQIPIDNIRNAYAQILQKPGNWKIRLAHFIINWEQRGFAYAQQSYIKDVLAKGNIRLITCPSDPTPPSAAVGCPAGQALCFPFYSYGINAALQGQNYAFYRDFTGEVISDCDYATFTVTVQADGTVDPNLEGRFQKDKSGVPMYRHIKKGLLGTVREIIVPSVGVKGKNMTHKKEVGGFGGVTDTTTGIKGKGDSEIKEDEDTPLGGRARE